MTAWLDAQLGRVTMYRLVLLLLGVFAVAALVFSILGVVQPGADWVSLLIGLAVLLVVSYGSNRLLALAFRMKPHSESALITAGLLFFILRPQSEFAGWVELAIAALIAMASKYLVAFRGRHIFNPAAFSALVVTLVGAVTSSALGTPFIFAAWWVGSPWMFPFVIVGGFLVLFRTRRLPMGAVYLGVGLIAYTAQYYLNGAAFGLTVPDALYAALFQSALVFFVGFMLTEPLTLPPRRWQQLLYAALAALIYSISFHIGPFYNSPEFALVVVNLLAFLAGQRRGIRLEYVARRQLSPTSWEVDFRPRKPVAFAPGQFMELTLPHGKTDSRGWRRVFSIASAPGELVRFGIRLPEKASSFKRALLALEPGTTVSATSVGGDFLLPADPARPLLLVAGGIGITPFIGHLEQAAAEPGTRDIAMVYAVSSTDDLAYAEQLSAAGCQVALASPEKPTNLPSGWTWIGPGRVTGDTLLAAVPDAVKREAFLSGPPAMVADLKRALRKAGVRHIHTDVFVGY